ncbi:MAG: 5-methyltetrahydropteroyltriglutamate--homocysteine S-methyltransferase, partial [Stellaceae bacterium]
MTDLQGAASATVQKPPFRADHVGSLLRPPELIALRERAARGAIDPADMREIEDGAIRDVVALQESIGLAAVTDGEFRREVWHLDFLNRFEGVEQLHAGTAQQVKEWTSHGQTAPGSLVVNGKLRRVKPIAVDDFKFLKAAATRTAKICIPAPTTIHRGQPQAVSKTAYPDIEAFWADIIAAYRDEVSDLVAAGCTYLQFDEVAFAYLCDETIRADIARNGEDPDRLAGKFVDVINAVLRDRPASLAVTMHTCRGNFRSTWRASGGYDRIAEAVFGQTDVDGFFLEYDTERAGGFEPLRFMPKGKIAVLGLVSTKVGVVESPDAIKRRIDEAAKFMPLDGLALSPQCGFSSTLLGNDIDPDQQRRKL